MVIDILKWVEDNHPDSAKKSNIQSNSGEAWRGSLTTSTQFNKA